jgi:hypothetical protein
MKDEAVLDFRWNTLPPVIQPQLPFKIRFDKMWLRYFGDGTLLYKFTVVRVYLHNEEQSIEGSFQVKTK